MELPTPTTWPLMCAFGITLMAVGVVTTLIVTLVGFLIALISAVGWFRSVFPTPQHTFYPLAEADRRPAGSTRRLPLTIEGELVAKSTGTISAFTPGDRVFHQKFGNGNVTAIDGNKLTIQFDKAGEKRVVDTFVERV